MATATLALLVAAPAAWADSGSSGDTPAASGTTTTTDNGHDSGTPDSTPASGQSTGQDSGTSVTPAADGHQSGSTDASSSTDQAPPLNASDPTPKSQGSSDQSATASAGAGQSDGQNTNVTIRTGQGGDDGSVTQGNSDAATASSSTSGGTAPAADGTSSHADATATQTAPGNTNVDVRVGSPGDVGGSTQSNTAQANAGASGNANANATQTSPGNTNVVVRVGSPGDNGPVDQQNTVSATAGSDAPTPASAGGGVTTGTTDQSVPTTGSASGENDSSTDQQIVQEQGGTAPDVGESPTLAGGTVDASPTGTASATQTGASNTNVSIRVGSPGKDGAVTQGNNATATGSAPGLGVVTTDGGTNANVSIVIPGDVSAPGTNWTWTWAWTTDGTPTGNAADAAPTSGPDWNWAWTTAVGAGASTSTGSSTTPAATGVFTWTWTWIKPDGTTSTWTWSQACSCNWSWTWTWDWSAGAPSSTPAPDPTATQPSNSSPAPTASYDTGGVSQQNAAAANAVAGAELLTSQTSDQQPDLQGADASQVLDGEQQATATATVSMVDPYNLGVTWGVQTGPLSQQNTLEADAVAIDHRDATQVVVQQQTEAGSATETASATNYAAGEQIAVATAEAGSTGTVNRNVGWAPDANGAALAGVSQWNGGLSSATAVNWESTLQWIQQFQNGGDATAQDAEAVNLVTTLQSSTALSLTWQGQLLNTNDVLVPAGSRATNPSLSQSNLASATAAVLNVDGTQQWISQFQGGESDLEGSLASNEATTDQSGLEGIQARQLDLVNRSGWLGVEPSPSEPAPPAVYEDLVLTSPALVMAPAELVSVLPIETAPTPKRHKTHRSESVMPTATVLVRPAAPAPAPAPCECVASWSGVQTTHQQAQQVAAGSAAHVTTTVIRRHARAATAPSGKNNMPAGAFGSGSSGSAPPAGSGPVAFATRSYKFATPAHFGSQVSAPALGPPVEYPDPFERPG